MKRTACALFATLAIVVIPATPGIERRTTFTVIKYDGLGDGTDALALLLSACGRSKGQQFQGTRRQ
jgi:hypothetical protein